MKRPCGFLAGWIVGLVTAGLLAAAAAFAILGFGLFDTSASRQHGAVMAWAVHRTMVNSVRRSAAPADGDFAIDGAMVLEGARLYERYCISCHGGPGTARARWASAMVPTPPFLIDAPRRWSRGELHLIIRDGIKMTAMPAWGEILPDRDVMSLVAFVQATPKLTPDQFAALRAYAKARPIR